MEDHLPKCRRKIMATFYLNTSPICHFNRKSVHSPVNAKHNRPLPKKRKYPTLPCLMISPVQTPISYVSCGKGSFDERGHGTPQGVAKDDGIAIRSFLKGKRIIVTGATGFIAKGKYHCYVYLCVRITCVGEFSFSHELYILNICRHR